MSFFVKPKTKKIVYLDHAATTPLDLNVEKAMRPYYTKMFANPSALYDPGREVNGALNDARRQVAEIIGALPDNIIFTSGGTEADNLAIFGVVRAAAKTDPKKKHIITTKIEHHAVLRACETLESEGFDVSYLEPEKTGFVSAKKVIDALRPETILVAVMYANNEIGTVEPLADIGREILKWRKTNNTIYPYFFSDACQAVGALDLNVEKLHVDLMSVNGGKIYGPKGTGFLYRRRGVKIAPLQYGGHQEFGVRAGTENIPGVVGLATAFALAEKKKLKENARLIKLRDYFFAELKKRIPKILLNGPELGDERLRLPNNLNVSFLNIEGEALLLYLNEYGIYCSTGSACDSASLNPSHVLMAIGLPYEYAHGSLRFTLGRETTKLQIDYVLRHLPEIVEKLRSISPVNLDVDPEKKQHPNYWQR